MRIEEIVDKVNACKKCSLWKTRKNPVVGDGDPKAKIMLVGEAPGYNEDLQGKPFVGAAGKVLDEMLVSIGLVRGELYITNILKCRPPNNRDPLAEEIRECTPYLDRQIEIINPKVICTLGNFATSYILKKYGFRSSSISKIHGRVFRVSDLVRLKVIPLFHPAALIYNQRLREKMREDLLVVKENI